METDGRDAVDDIVPNEALRSALELAVDVAAAGVKLRPPLPFPAGLRPLLSRKRLGSADLGRVRVEVDGDAGFRAHLADVATTDLVDEVGRVWLERGPGWEERLAGLVDGSGDRHAGARREHRRRAAAQEATERERADHATTIRRLARERERREALTERVAVTEHERDVAAAEAAAVRAELAEVRAMLRVARAQTAAAREDTGAALQRAVDAEAARDAVLLARAGEPLVAAGAVDLTAVRHALDDALTALAEAQAATRRIGPALAAAAAAAPREASGVPQRRRTDRVRRAPVPIPGGLYADSAAVAEHLLRLPGIVVLVDGYNVAKLGWPSLTLEAQRERLVATAEDVARRWGTDVTIVFDGADIPGASAPARRLVRVAFSPAGVSADDLLRAEVGQLDHTRAVVVVTNDQAVVNDVRAEGANPLTSDQFLAVARR